MWKLSGGAWSSSSSSLGDSWNQTLLPAATSTTLLPFSIAMGSKPPGSICSYSGPLVLPDGTSSAEGSGVSEADRYGGEEWQAQRLTVRQKQSYSMLRWRQALQTQGPEA